MSPTDITGNRAVQNYGEANTEWNRTTKEIGNFLHKSKQQPTNTAGVFLHHLRKQIQFPKRCVLFLVPDDGQSPEHH
jgi:hypothetical protein